MTVYRDNFTLAAPILRALNIPATIFLATGHIGQQNLFWWDTIAWCFKNTALKSIHLPELGDFAVFAGIQNRAANRN